MGYIFGGSIIWGIIWGYAAREIIINRGYGEEATKFFWLGFFFSFIAVIIAVTRPVYRSEWSSSSRSIIVPKTVSESNPYSDNFMTRVPDGGWRCSNCGKAHYSYETSCSCGKSRFDLAPTVKKKEAAISTIDETLEENSMNTVGQKDNTNTDRSPFDVIRKYKELLDEGIITQEEFDAKKKQLLGL